MPFRFLNNYETELGVALTAGATTLEITGDGAEFADASASNPYALTLCERDIRGFDLRREIVHVTGRAASVLTIVRAREGTTADDWPVGTPVEARDTAAGLNEAAQAVTVHEADPDPHPQYEQKITGLTYAREVVIQAGTLDLLTVGSEVSVAMPAGLLLFMADIEVIITSDDAHTGTAAIEAGPDAGTPASYLSNGSITGDVSGDRDTFVSSNENGAASIRVAVTSAASGTTYQGLVVLRGFLLEL